MGTASAQKDKTGGLPKKGSVPSLRCSSLEPIGREAKFAAEGSWMCQGSTLGNWTPSPRCKSPQEMASCRARTKGYSFKDSFKHRWHTAACKPGCLFGSSQGAGTRYFPHRKSVSRAMLALGAPQAGTRAGAPFSSPSRRKPPAVAQGAGLAKLRWPVLALCLRSQGRNVSDGKMPRVRVAMCFAVP